MGNWSVYGNFKQKLKETLLNEALCHCHVIRLMKNTINLGVNIVERFKDIDKCLKASDNVAMLEIMYGK